MVGLRGFTLVELLVVISIIAILASVSAVVYSSAQATTRDSNRRMEILAIAKMIEFSRNPLTGIYSYNATQFLADFPTGPYKDSKGNDYCLAERTTISIPGAMNSSQNDLTESCSLNNSDYIPLQANGGVIDEFGGDSGNRLHSVIPTIKAWTLCARMERATSPFCVSSIGR